MREISSFQLSVPGCQLTSGSKCMFESGKLLMVLGVALMVGGAVLILVGRTGLPLGKLPGDIIYRGKNTTFYFPLVTSILLSIVLSVVLYLLGRFRR